MPRSDWYWEAAVIHRLDTIQKSLDALTKKGDQIVALNDDILAAIAAETTAVDSLIAFVKGQVASGTITPAQAATIIGDINANRAKLEAALPPAV